MNKRIVCLAVALSTLSLVITTSSPAQAGRKSTKASSPGFLGAFSKAHQNLMVTFDLVPHVRAALQSKTSETMQSMLKERFDEEVSAATVLLEVNSLAPKIPSELAAGLTDDGVADLGRIAHAVVLGFLASEAASVEDQATLATVHGQLTGHLKKGGLDGLVLYGKLHSEDMAKGVMGMVVSQARMMKGSNPAITFDISDDAVGAVLDIGKGLTEADVSQAFVDFGVVPGREHPATSALVGAVRSIKQSIWFERIGAGLRLTFGRRARRARPLRANKLGSSFRATADDLLWSRWTSKPWVKAIKAVDTSLTAFEDTPAWRSFMENYPPELTGLGLSAVVEALERGELGKQGDSRLWVEGGALRVLASRDGMKKSMPIAKSSLSRLMPGAATMIHADTVHSIEGTLSALSQLFTGQLGPLGDAAQVTALTDRLEALFEKGADEVFESGGAFIVGWGGDVDTFSVVRSEEDGTQKRLSGTRLPNYGLGLVLPLVTGADGLGFGAKALTLTGEVLCAAGGGTLDADARITEPEKLGLGSPTLVVPWASMTACRVGKASTQVEVSGDLLLHTFQLGDALVLSTSRALSVRIASTYAGAHGAYRLPKPGRRGKLVGFGDFDGASLGAWVGSFATWVERIDWGEGDEGAESRGEAVDAVRFAADTLRLIDEISWTATAKRRNLATSVRITFQ